VWKRRGRVIGMERSSMTRKVEEREKAKDRKSASSKMVKTISAKSRPKWRRKWKME
jgi:hypothetical protein